MTTSVAPQRAAPTASGPAAATSPTFLGVLRGELYKLSRQRLNWWLALGLIAITLVVYIAALIYNGASAANHRQMLDTLRNPPQLFLWQLLGLTLDLQRAMVGIFLLIATARMIGLDFQQGTIRILLARGVGRLQLLGAKLAAVSLVGIGLLACGILLNLLGALLAVRVVGGNLDAFKMLSHAFWTDAGVFVLTVLVSMSVTILLAAAVTVVSRSLAFGLAGALGWFALDNVMLPIILVVAYGLTRGQLWMKMGTYLLGPELNLMPAVVVPRLTITGTLHGLTGSGPVPAFTLGTVPPLTYDGTHALMVALAYGAIFAAAAVLTLRRRDVLE
jgi:ABC-type transport system involved in multi-copper enzyme maturation permease subunit